VTTSDERRADEASGIPGRLAFYPFERRRVAIRSRMSAV